MPLRYFSYRRAGGPYLWMYTSVQTARDAGVVRPRLPRRKTRRSYHPPIILGSAIGLAAWFGVQAAGAILVPAPPTSPASETPVSLDTPAATPDAVTTAQRPRIGLQVGHWKNGELPDELAGLRNRSTGTTVAGITETEAAYAVAERARQLLESRGFSVELVPATVSPDYRADAFISLHTDGNDDTSVSGFKVAAAPHAENHGSQLATLLEQEYASTTRLALDPNVSGEMLNYYAFSRERFRHTIHAETPGVIIELGYLTNATDRRIIVTQPDRAAQGISEGIIRFLETK